MRKLKIKIKFLGLNTENDSYLVEIDSEVEKN